MPTPPENMRDAVKRQMNPGQRAAASSLNSKKISDKAIPKSIQSAQPYQSKKHELEHAFDGNLNETALGLVRERQSDYAL